MAVSSEGISTKVSVLGDKEYKKALSDIGRSVRAVKSELEASTSAFLGQEDSMEAMQAKGKALSRVYEEQASKAKLIAEQLNKAKAKYDDNSDAVQGLQIALNHAVTAMNKTQHEIKANEDAMREAAATTDKMGDGMQEAAKSGDRLGSSMQSTAKDIGSESNAAKDSEDKHSALGKALGKVGEVAKGALKAGLEAAATAIATLSAAALAGGAQLVQLGTDYRQAANQLSAQTGATGHELYELGGIAQQVYQDNFGDNMQDVNEALATTKTNTGLVGDELKKATENGYLLRDTFGMEFSESSRAAASLMQKFGLSADDAYNLIAVGAQKGANQNGDLLDVLSEYAPKYAEMGLTAGDFMTTLISGAQNGVFQIDKVGDAVKEFSIRAIDGSEGTAEAFKALGLEAAYVSAEISEGGPQARDAFLKVVGALQKVEDPLKRNQIAVALFGTQFEDLGTQALPILASIAEDGDLSADALSQINDVRYNDAASALEGVRRKVESEFLPLAGVLQSQLVDALSTVDEALSDGFQPGDIRVIGEAAAKALADGIGTVSTLIGDNMDVIQKGLDTLVATIVSTLPGLVNTILPAAMGLLQSVVDAVAQNAAPLATAAAGIVSNVGMFITQNAPGLLDAAGALVTSLVDGLLAGNGLANLTASAVAMVGSLAASLVENASQLFTRAPEILQQLFDGLKAVDWSQVGQELMSALETALTAAGEALTGIFDWLTGKPEELDWTQSGSGVVGALQGALQTAGEALSGAFDWLKGLAESVDWSQVGQTVAGALQGALQLAGQALSGAFDWLKGLAEGIDWSQVGVTMVSALQGALQLAGQAVTGLWDWLKDALGLVSLSEAAGELVNGLAEGLSTAAETAKATILKPFNNILQWIKDVFGIASPSKELSAIGGYLLEGLGQGLLDAVEGVLSTVADVFGRIWKAIRGIFGLEDKSKESKEAKDAGSDIMTGIKEGITGNEESVKTAVQGAAKKVLDEFKIQLGYSEGQGSTETKPMGKALAVGISDGLAEVSSADFASGASTLQSAVAEAVNEAFGVEGTGFLGLGAKGAAKFEEIGAAVCKSVADGINNNSQNTELVKKAITGVANAAYTAAVEEMEAGITGGEEQVNAAVELVAEDALEAAQEILNRESGGDMTKDFMEGLTQGISSKRGALVTEVKQTASAALRALAQALSAQQGRTLGQTFGQGVAQGIRAAQDQAGSAGARLAQSALSALQSAVAGRFESVGKAISQGVARGIKNGSGAIVSAAKTAAQSALNAAKKELDIHSPSRAMAQVGMQYDAGFASGIRQGMEGVMQSVRQLSRAAEMEMETPSVSIRAQDVKAEAPGIDYDRLGEAVAQANRRAGLGHTTLEIGGKKLGETLEPEVSRAAYRRSGQTAAGRGARMVLA